MKWSSPNNATAFNEALAISGARVSFPKAHMEAAKCDLVLNLGSLEIASRSADAQNLFQFDSTNCILPLSLNYFRKKIDTLYMNCIRADGRQRKSFLSGKEITADGNWRNEKFFLNWNSSKIHEFLFEKDFPGKEGKIEFSLDWCI